MNQTRIHSLDLIRLLLAYVIAFFHLGITLPPTPGVAVDIFFILSGYFLGRKYYSRSHNAPEGYTAWDYTADHARSILPHYLLSMGIFFGYLLARRVLYFVKAPTLTGLWEMGSYFYNQIPDLLFLQSAYHFHDSINYPAWQISALLIGGYFVYALLCCNEKLTRRILLPAAILGVQSLLYTGIDLFDNFGPIYLPIARAVCGLSIGVLTFVFSGTAAWKQIAAHRRSCNILCLLLIAAIIAYREQNQIYLAAAPFVVLVCCQPDAWLNRVTRFRIFSRCSRLSLAVYLNHSFIERIVKALLMPRIPMTQWQSALCYFVLLTGWSLCTCAAVEWWTARRKAAVHS